MDDSFLVYQKWIVMNDLSFCIYWCLVMWVVLWILNVEHSLMLSREVDTSQGIKVSIICASLILSMFSCKRGLCLSLLYYFLLHLSYIQILSWVYFKKWMCFYDNYTKIFIHIHQSLIFLCLSFILINNL